jgi:NhaA family Na+:H+ antiporter
LTLFTVNSKWGRILDWRHLQCVAWLGGFDSTMSLFISQLAFSDPILKEQAKLGILIASALSAVIGSLWLYMAGKTSNK